MPRFLIGIYALLALSALGYTGYWFHLAGRAEAEVDAGLVAWRADGLVVAYDQRRTFGYPYRLTTEVVAPSLARPDANPAWHWQGGRLQVYAQPWNLRHYIAVLEGHNRLTLTANTRTVVIEADAESARASLVLDGDYRPGRASVDIRALRLGIEGATGEVLVAALQAHARLLTGADGIGAVVIADGLLLPEGTGGVLGREVATLRADTTLSGPLPERLDAAAAAAWRDAGGSLQAHALVIHWGPLEIEASGTLGLDAALRPLVELSARIRGFGALIDGLAASGAMSPEAAAAAQIALALIAEVPADDPRPLLRVPITIRDGVLSAGPVPLMKVPPLFVEPPT